eukprot:TRINITY_DN3230_c0_g1_i1.p1 TRINITY_DN3230_c0_g1~~TRINITY_DN3230_c0_g1_i1.p1  ORF type:complete len:246 (+),score=81.08 TRINITY_DN3230_c0_g1_i1:78-815(+)
MEATLTPSDEKFWELFYDEGLGKSTYEWYATYASIKSLLLPCLSQGSRVLHIGCGNSLLAEQLVEDKECPEGVTVMNIDINETAINSMIKREEKRSATSQQKPSKQSAKSKRKAASTTSTTSSSTPAVPQLTYEVMDVCNTTFEEHSFDLIIDKGTLDALISTGEEESGENEAVHSLVKEMMRILKPTGVYAIVSRNANFLLFPYFYAHGCECEEKHFQHTHKASLFFYLVKPGASLGEEDEDDA